MTPVAEKPISTSCDLGDDLPESVKEFVHRNIQGMNQRELRGWKKRSSQLMRRFKAAFSKTERSEALADAQPVAGKMRGSTP